MPSFPASSAVPCALFALLLLLSPRIAEAADSPDIVALKNGGFVRGQVVEHDPEKGTTVLLADGTTKRYAPAEVASVRLASAPPAPPPPPPPLPPPPPETTVPVVSPSNAAEQAEGPRREDDERTANNSLFFEIGGNGVAYSVNYERHLTEQFVVRAGVGLWGYRSNEINVLIATIPVTASFLVGSPAHKFEIGAGVTGIVGNATGTRDVTSSGVLGTGIAGYRFNPPKSGFFFKIALTPLVGSFGFIPSVGCSLGAGF